MSQTVTISGTSYTIGDQGASPPWGADLNDLLLALVQVAQATSGGGDILTTSFNVANNQVAPANVTGASWDTSTVRGFILSYSLYRSTNINEESETGQIYGTYSSTANTWQIAQTYAGSSGISFTITNAGQLQYTSSNVAGTGYSGKLKFAGKSFLQA
jgi:hypothetical protein